MIVAVPDDRIAPWLALHSPGSVLHSPYYAASNGKKICTPYAARVCICIGITSTFQEESCAVGAAFFLFAGAGVRPLHP